MSEEENILKMVLERESWEEVLYHIVSIENIDPWNVDLIKLTDGFIKFIEESKQLDFRIHAKIVFVAAMLLKLKSDYLTIFEEQSSVEEALDEEKEIESLGIDPSKIKLGAPIKRIPKRQVTLNELVVALKKALEVRERKVERVQRIRSRLKRELMIDDDITKRIEKVMKSIEDRIKSEDDKMTFREIVDKWEPEDIVDHFLPILHLEKNRKIETEQEKLFEEIFIKKKKEDEEEE